METFIDLKELITTLKREETLISEMFSKRKALDYKYSYALEVVEDDPDRLHYLLQRGVLRENANFLELDDVYLDFFEQILAINESLNIAYIDENLMAIKENINYYLNESNDSRKQSYLRLIKKTLRKIGVMTLKNVIDLRRNIEETFKNEINYKNKQLKLENLDKKRQVIDALIEKTLQLINDEEQTFFRLATDEALSHIITAVKYDFRECSHNLIEIEKQIIDYLNQIQLQGKFVEKLRKVKHLKDHFLIKAQSNIEQVITPRCEVIFEPQSKDSPKLSLDDLRDNDQATAVIRRVADKRQHRKRFAVPLAEPISDNDLDNAVETVAMLNLESLKNQFIAGGDNLFDFLLTYDFPQSIDFAERVTLFCQIASQFEQELWIKDDYQHHNGIEFAMIYPR